jgi:hypothetical protein
MVIVRPANRPAYLDSLGMMGARETRDKLEARVGMVVMPTPSLPVPPIPAGLISISLVVVKAEEEVPVVPAGLVAPVLKVEEEATEKIVRATREVQGMADQEDPAVEEVRAAKAVQEDLVATAVGVPILPLLILLPIGLVRLFIT